MDEYKQKLKEYLTQQQQNGQSVETIRATLVQHGWDTTMVDESINELAPSPPAASISLPEPITGFGQLTAAQSVQVEPDPQQQATQQLGPYPQQPVEPASSTEPTQLSQVPVANDQQLLGDPIPQALPKYTVLTAIRDSVRSIKRNFKEFAAVAILSSAIVIGISIGIGFLITGTLLLKVLNAGIPALLILAMTLGLVFLAYVLTTIAMTFVQTVTTMAINEGADGRRTNIKAVMQTGMQRIKNVIITNVLIGLIAVGPLLVVSCMVLVLAFAARDSGVAGILVVLMLLNIAAIVWLFVALLRYLLAGQVAMLEPGISPKQCLSRSRHLLKGGGRWFIFKGTLLLMLIVIILAGISGQDIKELQSTRNPLLNVLLIIIEVIANGVLVMLYRNRRLVRDGQPETSFNS